MRSAAANHPDADALTAFSERALPELERATVLEHLARCGDCREIVALALPETESVELAVQPSSGGLLRWPVLRWAFVAAGVVVIAAVGIVWRQQQVHPPETAYGTLPVAMREAQKKIPASPSPANPSSDAVEVAKDQATPNPAVAAPQPSVAETDASADAANRIARQQTATLPAVGVGHGSGMGPRNLSHGPKANFAQQNANAFTYQQNANEQRTQTLAGTQIPSAPPASKPLESQGALATVAVEAAKDAPAAADTGRDYATLQPLQSQRLDQQKSESGSGHPKVDEVKSPGTTLMAHDKVPAGIAAPLNVGGALGGSIAASNARWSINQSGGLQRSVDQGNTWQDVNLNSSTTLVAEAERYELAKTSRAKQMDDEKEKQADKKKDAPNVFRAVTAIGSDVWAGGADGVLYHSIDAGGHWLRVLPASAGISLTGDIVAVEFSDAHHGKITTSTSEVWVTSDAGVTWQKQ